MAPAISPLLFLPLLHQVIADHVRDGQRAVVVAFFARHLIQLPQQRRRQGDTETADSFFFHGNRR